MYSVSVLINMVSSNMVSSGWLPQLIFKQNLNKCCPKINDLPICTKCGTYFRQVKVRIKLLHSNKFHSIIFKWSLFFSFFVSNFLGKFYWIDFVFFVMQANSAHSTRPTSCFHLPVTTVFVIYLFQEYLEYYQLTFYKEMSY